MSPHDRIRVEHRMTRRNHAFGHPHGQAQPWRT
jgi:hypothetical protein